MATMTLLEKPKANISKNGQNRKMVKCKTDRTISKAVRKYAQPAYEVRTSRVRPPRDANRGMFRPLYAVELVSPNGRVIHSLRT